MTVFTRRKVHILNFNLKCAFWIKIQKTVFWTMCTPNHIAMRNLKWRSRGVFQLHISQIMQRNHCMNALIYKSWFGGGGGGGGRGGAKWPSNHFRLYTARCICTEAQEMRAPCMFDRQGTQTFFSRWNAKSQIQSLVCTLHNSNIAITSLMYTA